MANRISKMGTDILQEMFTKVYGEQIARPNNLNGFECKCSMDNVTKAIKVEVEVFEYAGTPTFKEYKEKNPKMKNLDKVTIGDDEIGTLEFDFDPSKSYILNNIEYVVTYVAKM